MDVFRLPTFRDSMGSIVIDRDFANNPFAGGIDIQPSAILANLILYETAATKGSPTSGDPNFTLPYVLITSLGEQVVIDGKIGISFNFKNAGTCASTAASYSSTALVYPT